LPRLLLALYDGFWRRWHIWLNRCGIEAVGRIVESTQYRGHGWHDSDPCYRGRYAFIDRRGRAHTRAFSRYCFDYNDYTPRAAESWAKFNAAFAEGAQFRVQYVRWLPRLHRADFGVRPASLDDR
jgi:hypothetical protein